MLSYSEVKKLVDYVKQYPKLVSVAKMDYLIKLNYTTEAIYAERWNPYLMTCRGIIIDTRTYDVIAHPFDKFFNDHEYVRMGIRIPVEMRYWITEKLDGVLIIPYHYENKLCFSTRGSFRNEFIDKAYAIATFKDLPLTEYSFMFELISPGFSKGDFLVTHYDHEALVLVGVRSHRTGLLLTPPEVVALARQHRLEYYQIFENTYDQIKDLQNRIAGSTLEGWVIFFENQFLLKVKRSEYLNLFRIIKNINAKTILKILLENAYGEFIKSVPEELRSTVQTLCDRITQQRNARVAEVLAIFEAIPQEIKQDRKQFFLYISEHVPRKFFKYLAQYWQTRTEIDLHPHFYREMLTQKESK